MFFPDFETQNEKNQQPEKSIFIYESKNMQKKPAQIKLTKKKLNFKELEKILNIHSLRLFNSQGVQYFQDDLSYLKNKTVLYASKGEDFDSSNCFSQYDMLKKLGEGGFGNVYLAKHKQTQQSFAIKIIKTQNISSAADIDVVFSEAQVLKSLRHENIVKVHNCLTLKNMQVAIIMQFLEGGQLLKLVQKQKRLSQKSSRNYFKQIVRGMVHCHKNNLIHRDLKLQNLLLVNGQEQKIKIIDFGIAGQMNFLTWQDMDSGSLGYMAPQCFINTKNYKVDGRIDVWSTGVILFCMLTGELPFKGNNTHEIVESIKSGTYKIPNYIQKQLSPQCLDVLRQCLMVDCKKRITMDDLLDHPWLVSNIYVSVNPIDVNKIIEKEEPITKKPIKKSKDLIQNYKKH